MPKKTIEPLEITDTSEIPVVSVDIDTSYEAMLPDPVPATDHLWYSEWEPIKFRSINKWDDMLPLIATVIASIVTGASLIVIGILIGAGI